MENIPKWVVTYEYKDPKNKNAPPRITQIFYDLSTIGGDIQKVTENTPNAIKNLLNGSLFLGLEYNLHRVKAEIKPPYEHPLNNIFFIVWAGLDPHTVAKWDIWIHEGDDTYDVQALVWKEGEGNYKILGITADEPNLANTKTHIKELINFILSEPKELKYARFFRLYLPHEKIPKRFEKRGFKPLLNWQKKQCR